MSRKIASVRAGMDPEFSALITAVNRTKTAKQADNLLLAEVNILRLKMADSPSNVIIS